MYSKNESLFIPEEFDEYPVTSASFEFIQSIKLLEKAGVTLIAEQGELPQIAYKVEVENG